MKKNTRPNGTRNFARECKMHTKKLLSPFSWIKFDVDSIIPGKKKIKMLHFKFFPLAKSIDALSKHYFTVQISLFHFFSLRKLWFLQFFQVLIFEMHMKSEVDHIFHGGKKYIECFEWNYATTSRFWLPKKKKKVFTTSQPEDVCTFAHFFHPSQQSLDKRVTTISLNYFYKSCHSI